jgi:hypothetical protein
MPTILRPHLAEAQSSLAAAEAAVLEASLELARRIAVCQELPAGGLEFATELQEADRQMTLSRDALEQARVFANAGVNDRLVEVCAADGARHAGMALRCARAAAGALGEAPLAATAGARELAATGGSRPRFMARGEGRGSRG